TLGPFIYLHIQKKAEGKLLQEQRAYQATLRKASLGMGRVKDLKRLLSLIVHVVRRTVKLDHCAIYLYHQESNQYILKASKGLSDKEDLQSILSMDSPLIQYLKDNNEVLDYEEVKQRQADLNDHKLAGIETAIERLNGALVVPSFIEDRLLAIIVMGKKVSGKLYSADDMVVFSILANQSALAIENAQFYEDMKKTHKQLFEAEKMATIGTMADGLSHQINNRLHAMGFIAGDAIDTIKLKIDKIKSPEAKEVLKDLKNSLEKIEDNVRRGGEIVGGLLKYTRKGTEGYEAIDFNQLLKASIEMVGLKVKLHEFDIVKNFNGSLPKINGNFTQLQEVFFNLIDNAYDAMTQRKSEMKEEGYRGELVITAQKQGRKLEILVQDNGIGVKDKDKAKLFTPFFTTKHSKLKKGTGLGLYVIRQLIERNHGGEVSFSGEYRKGAQTRLVLPTV
ncbi:MAG: signal transduction histidine kinase, partial [Lysobacterales bacterium]